MRLFLCFMGNLCYNPLVRSLKMSIITANHLGKSFGVDTILEDISFHIDPGDKIALLGVNGADGLYAAACGIQLLADGIRRNAGGLFFPPKKGAAAGAASGKA